MHKVHIGAELFKIADNHKLSIVEIAKRAGYGQSMFYKHIKKEDLSFTILKRYADAMSYYFKTEIPEFGEYLQQFGTLEPSLDELSKIQLLDKIEYWKDQAYEATKRNNELLQRSIEQEKENDQLKRELEDLKRNLNKK
ncbi:hypothetical protein BWD42_06855 [Sphingobacterium sp. CZ-UAM]|uniref:hypothetical protein n=1 Tax=Sphingobacterium sp. CZ-UAM TaxID=1933868 RepID=UPI0009855E64|nr:hypothetical protein [Sphingobacterium sp. CZ-UAM]OOG19625.1 hypothetical protein BWD42_06855 [Sphingobacterium sp. CZ-UAM]